MYLKQLRKALSVVKNKLKTKQVKIAGSKTALVIPSTIDKAGKQKDGFFHLGRMRYTLKMYRGYVLPQNREKNSAEELTATKAVCTVKSVRRKTTNGISRWSELLNVVFPSQEQSHKAVAANVFVTDKTRALLKSSNKKFNAH